MQYIFDFIGKELLPQGFQLTTDKQAFAQENNPCINYSDEALNPREFLIRPHTLLFQTNIAEQATDCFEMNDLKAFFRTTGDLPFDIFAASFYLLSRYEEYLPYEKDEYGRYAHRNSIAYREKFLDMPLVNKWIIYFRDQLKSRFSSIVFKNSSFLFLPSYDIDIAWSYRHKKWKRQLGGFARLLLHGKFGEVRNRLAVLNGKAKDPFDAYGWMNRLHEMYKLKPYYFFLLAGKAGKYDKNISPSDPAMKALIEDHLIRYPVGIHPSWQSGDDERSLQQEISLLKDITGNEVLSSRQHYIRFTLPATFRRLISHGIRFDFSMGYGSINGFRASVATPFYWYDLENESATDLLLFPFCFMEANSFYEQKDTPEKALADMRSYYRAVKDVNGTFIMIWHNSFLGTDSLYAGWRDAYEKFVSSPEID